MAVAGHTFDGSSKDDFKEGDNQAEDKPDVNHLHVRGGRQLLYLAGEDGGHHQHDGQIHGDDIAKEVFVEEGADEGDEEQEGGGEICRQKLCGNLPLEFQGHIYHIAELLFT